MTEQPQSNTEDFQAAQREQLIEDDPGADFTAAAEDDISDDHLIEGVEDDSADADDQSDTDEGLEDDEAEPDRETAAQEEDDETPVADQPSENYDDVVPTMESVVEAILFASDEPLTPSRLVGVVEAGSVKQVRQCVDKLNDNYRRFNRAFRIEQIAGGYQMMTLPPYNHWLKKLLRVRTDTKLSQAALETLAIISYKQPIIRADVEAIRGVASGEVIRNLMYKSLVKIVGRAEVLGRPMLYGTTRKFLDVFGLNTLKDLPKVEELKKPQ